MLQLSMKAVLKLSKVFKVISSCQPGQQNTLTASLQLGKAPPNKCPKHDIKQSDGEAPVLQELLEIQNTPLLPSLPGIL